jgi:Flp pilus assembly protein TadD
MGKPDEAIPHLREAIRQNPNEADSYGLLAEILNRRGETNEAAQLLRQAQTASPRDDRTKPLPNPPVLGK